MRYGGARYQEFLLSLLVAGLLSGSAMGQMPAAAPEGAIPDLVPAQADQAAQPAPGQQAQGRKFAPGSAAKLANEGYQALRARQWDMAIEKYKQASMIPGGAKYSKMIEKIARLRMDTQQFTAYIESRYSDRYYRALVNLNDPLPNESENLMLIDVVREQRNVVPLAANPSDMPLEENEYIDQGYWLGWKATPISDEVRLVLDNLRIKEINNITNVELRKLIIRLENLDPVLGEPEAERRIDQLIERYGTATADRADYDELSGDLTSHSPVTRSRAKLRGAGIGTSAGGR